MTAPERFIPYHLDSAREHLAGRKGAEVEQQRLIAAHLDTAAERRAAGAERIMEVEHGNPSTDS